VIVAHIMGIPVEETLPQIVAVVATFGTVLTMVGRARLKSALRSPARVRRRPSDPSASGP
jgi:hypothetical protein